GVRELVPRAVRLRAPRSARLSQRDAIRLTDRRAARAGRSRLRMEGRRPSLPLDRQLVSRVRSLLALGPVPLAPGCVLGSPAYLQYAGLPAALPVIQRS